MNRRWFFGLLAAVALLPKRAVGQLKYNSYAFRAGFKIPRPTRPWPHENEGFLSVEPETPKPNQTTFTRVWTDGHDNAGETMQHITKNPRWTDVEKVTNEPLGSGRFWRHTVRWVETHR